MSNQGYTMTLRNYNPFRMSPPSINLLHLTVGKIYPRKEIIGHGHYSNVKGQLKVTP